MSNGIGKSQIVREWADKNGVPCVDLPMETSAPSKKEFTWDNAVDLILLVYKDKSRDWAEGYLQRAYDNSDHASYRELLKAEFGIYVDKDGEAL